MYNYKEGRKNIIDILKTKTEVIKNEGIPKDNSLFTYKNAYQSYVSAIFVDIKNCTELNELKHDKLLKLLRTLTSQIYSIFQDLDNHIEIGYRNGFLYAIYDIKNDGDLYDVFNIACQVNTFIHMFNMTIAEYGYDEITLGIGIGCGDELVFKVGDKENVANDKQWIGKPIVDAIDLSVLANDDGIQAIAMSKEFYKKIKGMLTQNNPKYKEWVKYSKYEDCYSCEMVITSVADWINDGMKD